jgi:hypothetical protein
MLGPGTVEDAAVMIVTLGRGDVIVASGEVPVDDTQGGARESPPTP